MTAKKIDKRRIGNRSPRRKRIKFTCDASGAGSVFLVGSFNKWDPATLPMKQDPDENWSVEVLLNSGIYEYKYFIDGEWRCRPDQDGAYLCPECVTNLCRHCVPNDHGTMNRVIEVV